LNLALKDQAGEVFLGDETVLISDPILYSIPLPEASWVLAVTPSSGWGVEYQDILWTYRGLFLLITLILPMTVYLTVNRQEHLALLVEERTKSLRQSEEEYRQLVELAQEGIWLIDKNSNTTFVNPSMAKMLGYSENEMIDKPLFSFMDEQGVEIATHNVERRKQGIAEQHDFEFIRKDGNRITVAMVTAPITDKDGNYEGAIAGIIDITERVQAEEEKHQMEVHLRQGQKLESIGTLASGITHEINNPLTGIMNYAQLIHDRIDPKESRLREFAGEIVFESERVAEIVHNLLTFSRQEKGAHSLVQISTVINGTLSLIRTIIKQDQIALEIDLPDDLPLVKCRSQQIQQVLMNLFTNARDALNERYPEYNPDKIIALQVNLIEKEDQRWLRISVKDHGAGIPSEIRERIFDPFYTSKDRALNTGLGLSISLGIVQEHQGELLFESEEGKHTCFYLNLPCAASAQNGKMASML
jgi:PAS domain S-box-containing protein